MPEKSTYILPLRIVIISLVIIFLLGAFGGVLASWLVTNRIVQSTANSKVIERVEKITNNNFSNRRDVIQSMSSGVLGIYDGKNQFIQNAVALTADGIAITPSLNFKERSIKVIASDGSLKSPNVLRNYPEKGITVFKVPGSYPAPRFTSDVFPGMQGTLIRLSTISVPFFASEGTEIERLGTLVAASQERYPAIEKVGYLSLNPGSVYSGAPVFSDSKDLIGIVLSSSDRGIVLLSSDLNVLLQDVLKHPSGEVVSIYEGMSGEWLSGPEIKELGVKGGGAFRVNDILATSIAAKAGLKKGDLIVGVDGKNFSNSFSLWSLLLESARENKPVTMEVKRGQEDMKILISTKI